MALSLGGASAVASITLDISGLESAAARASSILSSIGNVKSSGLDSFGKGIDDVGKRIDALRGAKLDVDASGVASEAKSAADAVQQVGDAVKEVSGTDLKIDTGHATADVKETEQAVKSLGDQIKDLDGAFSKVGGTLSVVGGGITAAFGFASKASNDFEQAMQNVQSIAQVSTKELDAMSKSVLEISKATGKGPQDLAEALYDVASSGFEGADALEILSKSAIAARAGMTDTGTAVRAVSAVLNAYKLDASEAGNVTDVLFKTVDSGVITFEQLARNMGQTLPLAAALKVSIQELGAAYATLTLAGISPAEAETSIAAVMRAAINPTTQLTEAVKQYGFSSAEALIQAQGFTGFLTVLQEASAGSSEALTQLLGTADATTGVLALLANNSATYTTNLQAMSDATQNGATTQGVLATQMDSTQASLQNASAAFDRFKISVGEALGPAIRVGADALTGLLDGFTQLPGPIQATLSVLGALTGVLTLTVGAFILAVPKVVEFIAALRQLQQMSAVAAAISKVQVAMQALSFLVSPLGIALAAIVAVGALVAKSWYDQKKAADEYNGSLKTLGDTLEMIRRRGDTALADMAQGSIDLFNNLGDAVDQANEAFNNLDYSDFLEKRMGELLAAGVDQRQAVSQIEDEWNALANSIGIAQEKITKSNDLLNEALNDPDIDVTKYINWRNELINTALAIEDPIERVKKLNENLDLINSTPLSDFSKHAEESGQAAEQASGKWEKFFKIINDGIASLAGKTAENLPDQSFLDKLATALGADKYDLDALWAKMKADRQAQFDAMLPHLVQAAVKSYAIPDIDNGFAGVAEGADRAAVAAKNYNDAGQQAADTTQRIAQTAAEATTLVTGFGNALNAAAANAAQNAAEMVKQSVAAREMLDSYHEMRGVDTILGDWNLTSRATEASQLAENIQSTGYAIDNATRVIIGNTNAIGQQVQALDDWATELIGVRGEQSALDDLLASKRIDSDQWEAAQQAQEQIRAANESIKTSIQDIQATAAPVLGDLVTRQAAYLEQLSGMDAGQQLVALGWMDSATSAKAYELYTQAAAVANGEFGASGEKMFESVIQGAVSADPVLGALLEDMGLISVGADGTVTVHYDSAKGATSEIAELTKSIDALTLALGGIPPVHVDPGNIAELSASAKAGAENVKSVGSAADAAAKGVGGLNATVGEAIGKLGSVSERVGELGNQHAEPTVEVQTGDADSALQTLSDHLGGLDGKTITTRVQVLLDDQTGGGIGGGAASAASNAASNAARAITIPIKYGAPPPLELPTPPPIVVPVTFDTSGGGDLRSPTGIDGPFSGAGGAGGGISIAVTVMVTGTEQLDAVKKTIDGLSNKPVAVSVAVSGAELIGALKLDVQNLSNKTLTIMVSVSGAEAIGTLKTQLGDITSKAFTISADASDALQDTQAVIGLLGQVNAKAFTITSDNTDALTDIQAVLNLLAQITSKAFSITSDATDATTDIGAVKTALEEIAAKTVVITSDATIAFAAIDNVNGATVADKTLVIFGDATIALAALDNVNGTDVPAKTLVINGDASGALGAINSVTSALNGMPSSKTVTVNVVTSGSVPALAKGGYVPGLGPNAVMARMAERGPELYRTPRGNWGLARTDGLYPMMPGSYVYTASRTKNMLRQWDGPAYAGGGRVASPTASAQRGANTTNASTTYHVAPSVTINPQSTLTDRDMDHITEQVSGAIVTAVQTRRYAKGGS